MGSQGGTLLGGTEEVPPPASSVLDPLGASHLLPRLPESHSHLAACFLACAPFWF